MTFAPSHFDYLGFRVYHCKPDKWTAINIEHEYWPVGGVVMTWQGLMYADEDTAKEGIKADLKELLMERGAL